VRGAVRERELQKQGMLLQGNKNWMRSREGVMRCDSLNCSAKDRQELLPIVNESQSDSGALDNVMELLVRSGRDIAEVMMMLIPEAWQNDPLMPADRKAFYQCAASSRRTDVGPLDCGAPHAGITLR
jgi:glutamate synthase domain-containing protein 1